MSTAMLNLWITLRTRRPSEMSTELGCSHLSRLELGMRSNTRALKSLPLASMLEQQVMMLFRLRCLTLRRASHSDRKVLEAPTWWRWNTFTATGTSWSSELPFAFSDRVPR